MDFVGESERLKREVSHHLRDRQMPDPDNQRLLNELAGITTVATCCVSG